MARYDRIAPLAAPTRENSFPAWAVLRDIEGNDRDAEVCRRARLRFLALRPVRRLLDRGMYAVGRESYEKQIEAVREELGHLPARDMERARLARFLHQIAEPDAARITQATIEMGEAAERSGEVHAAREYAHTALGLAQAYELTREQGAAHRLLARVARSAIQWQEAEAYCERAAQLCEQAGDLIEWARARGENALLHAQHADAVRVRVVLAEALRRARAAGDAQAESIVEARFCTCELMTGNASSALEHGWVALRQLEDVRERAEVLYNVGYAFTRLQMYRAAERSFTMVAQRATDPTLRARARAGLTLTAAGTGNLALFRERRSAILGDGAEWQPDNRLAASVHLELGRACVVAGDVDFARDHIRQALALARRRGFGDILASAEEVLGALEQNASGVLMAAAQPDRPASEVARRIAEQIEALPETSLATS